MKNMTVYKETTDDWYCGFVMNRKLYVQVNFSLLHDGYHRVSVWGNDDFGMDIDFECEVTSLGMFIDVLQLNDITKDKLTEMGFKQF